MKNTLTKEEESLIPVYYQKWLDIGHQTKKIDRDKAKQAVEWAYSFSGIDKPKYFVFLDSPMMCQMGANLIKNSKFDEDSQLGSQLRSQLGSKLDSQLRSKLGSKLDFQLDFQLEYQLRSQLGSKLYSQLNSKLYSQLNSKLDSQLSSKLDSQLYSKLYSQLDFQLNSKLDSQRYQDINYRWYWSGYYGFYDYILNVLFPEKKEEFSLLNDVKFFLENVGYFVPFKEIVFISENPNEITKNNEGDLHSFDDLALKYQDGWGIYSINGLRVPDYIVTTPKEEFTKDTTLEEKNADFRRAIIQKIGIEKAVEILGAKVHDSYQSPVGGAYELLMIDYTNTGDLRPYLKMNSKSIDAVHIEGVEPDCSTVTDAIVYRNKLNKFIEPEMIS